MDAGMIDIIGSIAVDLVVCVAGQFFSVRTEIDLLGRIKRKVRNAKKPRLGIWWLPAVNAILET